MLQELAYPQIASKYAESVVKTPEAVQLEPALQLIAENQARSSHEGWVKGKMAQGYVYGPKTNDDPKKGPLTNPNLVPYDELSDDAKASNIKNAVSIIKILRDKDVKFVPLTTRILYPMAKEVHDAWSRERLNAGWVWGPVTDKDNKIHRDLLPFEVLAVDPNLKPDIKYDVDTARDIIIGIIKDNDVFPVISNLAAFELAKEV